MTIFHQSLDRERTTSRHRTPDCTPDQITFFAYHDLVVYRSYTPENLCSSGLHFVIEVSPQVETIGSRSSLHLNFLPLPAVIQSCWINYWTGRYRDSFLSTRYSSEHSESVAYCYKGIDVSASQTIDMRAQEKIEY